MAEKKQIDPVESQGETTYTGEGTIRESPEATDSFSLTRRDHEDYQLRNDMVYSYVRNPEIWERTEGNNRVRQLEREYGLCEVPTDKRNRPLTLQDTILVGVPREVYERREQAQEAAREAFESNLEPDAMVDGLVASQQTMHDLDDKARLGARMAREHQHNVRNGMIGNPETAGLGLLVAREKYTDAEIAAEEARFRRGARHQEFDDEQWAATLDRMHDPPAAGQRAFGFPGVKFGRDKLNISAHRDR